LIYIERRGKRKREREREKEEKACKYGCFLSNIYTLKALIIDPHTHKNHPTTILKIIKITSNVIQYITF
jgi:DNA-binding CsgD family transcriptional regulator